MSADAAILNANTSGDMTAGDSRQPASSQPAVDDSADDAEESPLGFVYFDESSPVAGTEQKIAIAVDDQSGTVSSATLTYETPSGEVQSVASQTCSESAALFSFQTEEPGDYQLVEMRATVRDDGGSERATRIDLAENGESCSFEARQDEGPLMSAMSEDDTDDEADAAETMTVYVLDNQSNLEAAESIDDALIVAQEASTFAMSRSGGFVIALDPGHGGTDSGAVGSGLKESDINWKIAQACKAELENYSGVNVVLTRSQNECPTLYERAERAVNMGAKVFVSLHINSTDRSSADGAEVYYPNDSSYNRDAHETGKELSQNILNELTALGLQNRGIKVRSSANNSRYPDGSLRDYYGVIANTREMGIPGIIVEHAFITNPSDNAKLKDDNFLKKLGVADAQGIAKTYGLSKGGWEQLSDGTWRFKKADGSYSDDWEYVNGAWYYFDPSTGVMKTGWQTIRGARYYLHPSGAMQPAGWFKQGNDWYWITSSGAAAKDWALVNGAWYYFDPTSYKMQTAGWFKHNNDWYWIASWGAASTGWARVNGSWYYFDPTSCKMQTGWTTVGDARYYLHPSGAMQPAGWFKQGDDWYWIASWGAASTGWARVNGSWYYFDPTSCKMQTGWKKLGSTWYYLDGNGAMATGWLKLGDTWYYLQGSGAMATGWLTLGENKYYLDSSGAMAIGERTIDGQKYSFDSSGALIGNGTPIMGTSKTTAAAMTQAYVKHGSPYPSQALGAGGAPDAATFCRIIYEEANAEGVRAEVLFAQIMCETGWLQFGGDVKINQFNFGGIGATGNGVPGNSFKDVRTGIRAQVQHLKAYASTGPLKNTCVDPRFNYVSRGCAKFVEWLGIGDNPTGQGWCAGSGYGAKLKDIMKRNLGI